MTNTRAIQTMEEFARVSGISRPTLSKYFNDPDSVRKSTRAKIEAALETHAYTPNVYAINQNRRTTRNIGIVVPNLADPFFTEIGRRAESACLEAGYRPILLSSHGGPDQEIANLESLVGLKPAGVLLAPYGRASDQEAVKSYCERLNMVLFDANIESSGLPYFGTDNAQSIDLMVDYLCRSGEPPCFFEMKTPLNPNARKRRAAYLLAMERQGVPPHVHSVPGQGWDFEQIGFDEGGRLLAQGQFETKTVLCGNDRLAIGLLSAAYAQGVRVGRAEGAEMRIAGHDDHPFARFTGPRLTTIAQDYSSIAESATRRLFSIIDENPTSYDTAPVEFPGQLIMRDSA